MPNARRLVDTAWAGGALPIVVVSSDPDGARRRAPSPARRPCSPPRRPRRPARSGQICRGIDVARAEVDGTDAALVWPARMGWVDAETVTSLIEAHGADRAAVLRPAFRGEAGWPALVPVAHLETLRALDAGLMPGPLLEALVGAVGGRLVELGDPGHRPRPRHAARRTCRRSRGRPEPAVGASPRVGLAGRGGSRRAARSGQNGRLRTSPCRRQTESSISSRAGRRPARA